MTRTQAWFQRLKLNCDEPLSNVAINFNLRRYSMAIMNNEQQAWLQTQIPYASLRDSNVCYDMVGRCRLTPG
jgi:hypothetical protein